MTRLARVVAVGLPHHVTQRGNARRFILDGEADRRVYLDLVRQSVELHSLALIGTVSCPTMFTSLSRQGSRTPLAGR
jgi:REP element-mobilizing transposase RayT